MILAVTKELVLQLTVLFQSGVLTADVPVEEMFEMKGDLEVKKAYEKLDTRRVRGKIVFKI